LRSWEVGESGNRGIVELKFNSGSHCLIPV
jgi:hypothetical protein